MMHMSLLSKAPRLAARALSSQAGATAAAAATNSGLGVCTLSSFYLMLLL